VDAVALGQLLAQGHSLPGHLLRFRPPQRTLLLVDDEPNVVSALKRLFRRDGHAILTANSGEEGLQVLAQAKVDVIISDQRMPGMTGVEFLREAKKHYPDTIRIVLSGYTELQSVTDAINEGAIYRFLTKPWVDEQLREQVHKAFEHVELLEQNRQLDIKIRTTNQELMAANRHLGALIEATRRQVQTETASLAVLREALQLIPTPILGVDDQMVIMFTNDAADLALVGWGGLLGCPLHDLDAELAQWLAEAPQGQGRVLRLAGLRWGVAWRSMGKTSTSRGTLLSLQPLPEPVQGGTP
jgi:CheY-like chemotaxis protein